MAAEECFVSALRILRRCRSSLWLRVAFHNLDRQVSFPSEDKQPDRIGAVNFPVCSLVFERGVAPRSDKLVPHALTSTASLAPGQRQTGEHRHGDSQRHTPRKNSFFTFSGPPFFATLRGSERLALESLRLRSPVGEARLLKRPR